MNRTFSIQEYPDSLANTKNYLLLFIIWPFLAFLTSLMNYHQKEAKKVVYFFLIYYGLTFVILGVGADNIGVDSATYAYKLKMNAQRPFSDFFKIVGGLYATDTSVDILEPLISFIVSRFTDYHGILFAVYAAIFGFFYLKSINLLYDRYRGNQGINALIYFGFFIFILPITSINGFRMWTAAWIFFYGSYHVILHRDPKYLLVAAASSLVHFSFLSASLILIVYYLAGNRTLIYLVMVVVSYILPRFITPFLQSASMSLGGGIQDRFNRYSSIAYTNAQEEALQGAVWFIKIGNTLVFYYLIFSVLFTQLTSYKKMNERSERNLFNFLLLFLAFVNFGLQVPSFGERFQILFFMFATLYLFMYFVKNCSSGFHILPIIGLFPLAVYCAVVLRLATDSINAWILSPGLGLPLLVQDISIGNFLFQ